MEHRCGETPVGLTGLPVATRWRWLWSSEYYDGPISGMVLLDNEQVWAQLADECDNYIKTTDETGEDEYRLNCDFYRRYRLIRLVPSAFAEVARRHQVFQQMVGRHTDYDEHGRRAARFESPPGWHDFYDLAASWTAWTPDGEPIAAAQI